MAAKSTARRPRRRGWQVLCRAAVLLALLGAGAYAALPWWVPAEWLSRQIAADLARQLGVPVTIDGLSLSWFDGVELRGLRIASPKGFGGGPVVTVRSLRTELAPVEVLLHRRLAWLELTGAEVHARFDAHGNTNLRPLSRLEPTLAVGRISVSHGRATLALPNETRRLALAVRSLQVDAGRIGDVAMSAALEQDAPSGDGAVSLSPAAGSGPRAAAAAALTFANIDLAQLPIASLLRCPLKKLSGRCDGAIELEVGRDAVIDAFTLDVRVRRLDVQPEGVALPVIDEAHLRVVAAYDQIDRALEVRSASVRLPGIDLQCRAKVFAELLGGHWEAIESLDLRGRVHPAQLAALLTGRAELPGDLTVVGPVGVSIVAEREGMDLHLRLTADATGAELRRGGRVLKPAGRPCDMGLAADLHHQTSGFTVTDSWLDLAGNRFHGHGEVGSLRRFTGRLGGRGEQTLGHFLLAELARLKWHGEWQIQALAALRDVAVGFCPPEAWPDVSLAGLLKGRWFLHHGPATRVHVIFEAPPETQLRLPGAFVKPDGVPLHLDLSAAIDPDQARLRDLAAVLSVGPAHLAVEGADIDWGPAGPAGEEADGAALELTGRLSAEKIEQLLPCVPGTEPLRGRLRGGFSGQFDIRQRPHSRRARLSLVLTDAALDADPWLRKDAGLPAELHVDFRADPPVDGKRPNLLACLWSGPQADVTVNCRLPALPAGQLPLAALARPLAADMDWVVEAVVKDARRLAGSSAVVAERLAGTNLSGQLKLTARGTLRDGTLDADVFCDATDLRLDRPNPLGRTKPGGARLTVRLEGRLAPEEGRLAVELRHGELVVGASRLAVSGRADLPAKPPPAAGRSSPLAALGAFQLDANALVSLEPALLALAPELDGLARRHGLSGQLTCRAAVSSDGNELALRAHVDATQAALGELVLDLPAAEGGQPRRLGPIVKPADMPAHADLDATGPTDLSRVLVRGLDVRIDELHLLASGSAGLGLDANCLPAALETLDMHVAASTGRAERLSRLLPKLAGYGLGGGLFVDAELPEAHRGSVAHATVRFDDARWVHKGKPVAVRGEVEIDRLTPPRRIAGDGPDDLTDAQWLRRVDESLPRIGRVRTKGLEIRVGEDRAWLLADLSALPDALAGEFHVLAEDVDAQELADWLAPPRPSEPGPTTRPSYKLTAGETDDLRRQAGRASALARKYLAGARLTGRASIRRLRAYDISVDQSYVVSRLELKVGAENGRVAVEFSGGLNGGLLREHHSTDLTAPAPEVASESTIDEILAEENIQPQLARFFPGNTVHGTFSRRETTTAPLADALAAAMDPRYPVRRVGHGKTVATDGVTRGRAAPKFMTGIFPGLNLATYPYTKMTAFAELQADGTAKNDMVFQGTLYDLYMEGTTDAENIGRYEIGLILLGAPQTAEWNHTFRQGRIPLLNFKARIEGGRMYDQEVSYLWPNETLFVIFLKNNIFYRIWLAAGENG